MVWLKVAVGAAKLAHKGLKAYKKSKKNLETKGSKVKSKLVKKEIDKAKTSSNPNEAAIKAYDKTSKIIKTPDVVIGAGASVVQKSKSVSAKLKNVWKQFKD